MERPLLIDTTDWVCMDEGEGLEGHILHWLFFETPEPDTKEWVAAAIGANPGIWTAELCRQKHGNPPITRCGLCREYANPRKRARAAKLPPLLPGFSEGAFQLYKPCSKCGLAWLQRTIRRLEREQSIERKTEKIPDSRQARGWDWATRLYPAPRCTRETPSSIDLVQQEEATGS